jgi:hypothetical protein
MSSLFYVYISWDNLILLDVDLYVTIVICYVFYVLYYFVSIYTTYIENFTFAFLFLFVVRFVFVVSELA